MDIVDTIYHGDARDLMASLPDECIDLTLTDPPYGIGYKSNRPGYDGAERKTRRNFGEDALELDWLPEVYRLMKPDTCLYLFTRFDVMHEWREAISSAGFKVVTRIVWAKPFHGMGDLRYYGPQTEEILFAIKGVPQLRYASREGNIWHHPLARSTDEVLGHPTQKPVGLLKRAILHGSDRGDLILDPFMGVGSTAAAAVATGRHFIGAELDDEFCRIARERVRALPVGYDVKAAGGTLRQTSLFE